LDFAKMLLLGLEGIGGEIFDTLACLLLLRIDCLLFKWFFEAFALNFKAIHCLNNLLFLLAVNLSHSNS